MQEVWTNIAFGDRAAYFRIANTSLLQVLTNEEVIQQLEKWKDRRSSNAMFKSTMNYLHQVEFILYFVKASRNEDLAIHVEAGDALIKLLFTFYRMKYKRLWPRYIADMNEIKKKTSSNITRN